MNWLFFALLAPALYTTVNFVDKYIVERQIPDYRAMVIFTAILSLIAGILFWIVTGFPLLSPQDAALMLLAGMLRSLAGLLYFAAMSRDDASNIVIFLQMTPLMVLGMSSIFLQERLTQEQLLGFVMIFTAGIGLALKRGGGAIRFSPGFFFIIGVAFLEGATLVFFKFITESLSFSKIISYESWGIALGGLIIYLTVPAIRRAFNTSVTTMSRRGIGAIFGNESLFIVAKTTSFVAVSLGPVTLVSVLSSTSLFFAIIAGWLLTLYSSATYQEDISRANLLRKGVLVSILFVGIWLVN
jgi:drug/metabolite transporter (DMT)-like permease